MPSGAPMMSTSLARILGIPLPKLVKILDRISLCGVSSREDETAALVNRRMVKDEHLRQVRAEAGRLGGNPNLVKQNDKQKTTSPENVDKQILTPSSSPSSSPSTSSSEEETPIVPKTLRVPEKLPEGFEQFWDWYPKKKSKGDALKAWKRLRPSAALLMQMGATLSWQAKSFDWTKDSGQFIPYPASWINSRGWEDDPLETRPKDAIPAFARPSLESIEQHDQAVMQEYQRIMGQS